MNIKKQILTILTITIFFATPLLKGMELDLQKFYKSETNTLDLTHMNITLDFFKKNKDALQSFIFKNAVQKLDLQGNGLKEIPVCLGTILFEDQTPLKEINIVFPKLGVGVRSLLQYHEVDTLENYIRQLKLNIKTQTTSENTRILLTLSKKQ